MKNKTNKVKWTKKFKALIISLSLVFAVALGGACTAVGLSLSGGDKLRGGSLAGGVADENTSEVPAAEFRLGDEEGVDGNVYTYTTNESQWKAAVKYSLDNAEEKDGVTQGALVKFVLGSDWTAYPDYSIISSGTTLFGVGEEAYAGTYTTDTLGITHYGSLCVPTGSNIILELNGHTIDRARGNGTGGHTIVVCGKLTLNGEGVVKGGSTGIGGNVYVQNGTFIMNGGTITEGAATSQGGGGVGVGPANNITGGEYGTFIMNGGTITGNSASNGGGVAITDYRCVFEMNGGTITGNTATGAAGIYSLSTNVKIKDATISNNTSAGNGGGMYIKSSVEITTEGEGENEKEVWPTVTMKNVTFNNNVATAGHGGGIQAETAASCYMLLDMTDCVFTNNSSLGQGGGISLEQRVRLNMQGEESLFEGNIGDFGGAIHQRADGAGHYEDNKIVMHDVTFNRNENFSGNGGALCLNNSFSFIDCIFTNNVNHGGGGGVLGTAHGTQYLEGCTFTGNRAEKTAGAISITLFGDGGEVTIKDCNFTNNETAGLGGAIYVTGTGTRDVKLIDCTITGNKSNGKGGGIYVGGGPLILGGVVTVKDNTSSGVKNNVYLPKKVLEEDADILDTGIRLKHISSGEDKISAESSVGVNADSFYTGVFGNYTYDFMRFPATELVSGNLNASTGFMPKNIFVSDRADTSLVHYNSNFGGVSTIWVGLAGTDSPATLTTNAAKWKYATENSGPDNPIQVDLVSDWIADDTGFADGLTGVGFESGGKQLYVPGGRNVILNVNGYKISRAGKDWSPALISVSGTGKLVITGDGTISDCNTTLLTMYGSAEVIINNVKIEKGAYAAERATIVASNSSKLTLNGPALYVGNNIKTSLVKIGVDITDTATLTMNSGDITSVNDENGGGSLGVRVRGSAKFILNDGNIFGFSNAKGNETSLVPGGGGVYVAANGTFEMNGGFIKNNKAVNGAGVYNEGTFTFNDGNILSNTAAALTKNDTTEGGYGGGVYNTANAKFTMKGGRLYANSAVRGGGIYADGTVNLEGGVFYQNSATEVGTDNDIKNNSKGGNVYVAKTFNMTGGLIRSYSANAAIQQAAFVPEGGTFNFSGGRIERQSGTVRGIFLAGGTVNMSGTAEITGFTGNLTPVYIYSGEMKMSGGEIHDNSVSGTGGGIYLQGGKLEISGTAKINKNMAVNGAAVGVDGGEVKISGGEIRNNKSSGNGGAVYVFNQYSDASFTMTGGKIFDNRATMLGGGVYISNGTFDMSGGEISGNAASYRGGGVCVSGGSFSMTDGKIKNNSVTNSGGGGIYFIGSSTVYEISGGEISGNTANTGGGAIILEDTGAGTQDNPTKLILNGVKISENISKSNGGGVIYTISTSDGYTYIEISGETLITGNKALGTGNGGAILLNAKTKLVMNGGTISNNTSDVSGGAVYLSSSTAEFEMHGGTISGNAAVNGGAGVYTAGTFTMDGSAEISGNTGGYGSGVLVSNGTFTLTNGKISENNCTAGSGAGVSVSTNGTFNMDGGEISGNISALSGGGVYVVGEFNMTNGQITKNNTVNYAGGLLLNESGVLNMSGGSITDNTAEKGGGGVLIAFQTSGVINVSGNPVITGNTGVGKKVDNVSLQQTQVINISGVLNTAADIGVTISNNGKRVFTSGLASSGLSHPNVVFSADNKKLVVGVSDGEATLLDCININLTIYDENGDATETTAVIKVDAGEGEKVTYTLSDDKSKYTFTSTQGGRTGVTTVVNVPVVAGYTPYIYNPADGNSEVASGTGALDNVTTDKDLCIGYRANTNTAYTVYYILQQVDGSYTNETRPTELNTMTSVVKKYTGSGTTDQPLTYKDEDGKALVPTAGWTNWTDRLHYTFDHLAENTNLNIDGDGSKYVLAYMKLNEYTVTFSATGATDGAQTKKFKFGATISDDGLKIPSKDMNTFAGWYYDAACTEANKVNFGTDTVTENKTVYAKFTTKQYSLIFDLNLGTDNTKYQLNTDYVLSETAANLAGSKVKWDTATLFPEASNFNFSAAEGTGRYQISYDINNVSSPKNLLGVRPSAIGYRFLGWFSSETATSQTQTIRKPTATGAYPTADEIVLTARWQPMQYSITLEPRNGEDTQIIEPNNLSLWKDILPEDEPEYAGYTFDGWYVSLDEAKNSAVNNDIFMWSSNSEQDNEKNTALFSIYDFGVYADLNGRYGNADDGYNFNNLTLYAGWRSVPVRVKTTASAQNPLQGKIEFKNATGGSISTTTNVNIGDQITVEITPNDGYKFNSMTVAGRTSTAEVTTKEVTNDKGKKVTVSVITFEIASRHLTVDENNPFQVISDESVITSDLYVVVGATFTELRYNISYELGDGAKSTDSTFARTYSASELAVNSLTKAKLPSKLIRRGYIFEGWVFSTNENEIAYDAEYVESDEETGLYNAELYLVAPYNVDETGFRDVKLKAKWRAQASYVYLYNATYSISPYDYEDNNKRHVIGEKDNAATGIDFDIANPEKTSFIFMGWATTRNGAVVYPAVDGQNYITYKINAHKDEKGNLLNLNNLYAVWQIEGVDYVIMAAENNGSTYGSDKNEDGVIDGITMSAQTARRYTDDENIKLDYTWYKIHEGHYDECFDIVDFEVDGYKVYVNSNGDVIAYEKEGTFYDLNKNSTSQTKADIEAAGGTLLTYKEFNATRALENGLCELKTFPNTTDLAPADKCYVNVKNVKDCGIYVCVVEAQASGDGLESEARGYGEIEITMNKAVYGGVDMADTTVAYNTAPRYDAIFIKNAEGKDPTTTDSNNVNYLTLPDGSKLIVTYRYYVGTGEARTEITDLNQIKTVGTYHTVVSFVFTPDGDKGNYELPEAIEADLIIVPDTIGNLQYVFMHGDKTETDTTKFNGPYDGEEYKVVANILDTTGIGSNSLVTSIDDVAFDMKVYRITETGDPVEMTEPTTEAGSYYLQIVGLTGNDAGNYALGSGLTLRADYTIGKKAYDIAGKISFTNSEVPFDNELHTIEIKLADDLTMPDDINVVYRTSYLAEVEDFTAGRLSNKTPNDNGGRYAGVYTVTVEFEFKTEAAKNNYAALESMTATLTITKANFFNFYNVDGVDLLRDAGFINAAYAYQVGTEYHPYISGSKILNDTDHFDLSYEYYRVDEDENGNRLGRTILASGTHAELVEQGDFISLAGKYEIVARIKFVSALYRNNFEEIEDSESTVTYVIRAVAVANVEVSWADGFDKVVSLGAGFDYSWIKQITVTYAQDEQGQGGGTKDITREADIALAGIKLEQNNGVAQTTFWKVGSFSVIVSFYGKDGEATAFTVKEKVADVQLQYRTDSDQTFRPVRADGLELVDGVTYSFQIEYKCTNEQGVANTTKYSALTYEGALALGSNVLTASEAYYEFDEITVDMYKVIDSVTWQYKLVNGEWKDIPEDGKLVYAGAEYLIQAVFEDNGTQALAAHAAQGLTVLNYNASGYLMQVGRSGNYFVTAEYSLDITKLVLEVDWDVNELPYNTWHRSPKATAKNMKTVDSGLITFDYGFEIDGQPTTSANVINVGTYVVKLILTGDETACSNYTLVGSETAEHEFKIVQADLDVNVSYNEHNYGPNTTFRGNTQGLRLNAMKADFGENAVVEGKFAFITNYSAATGKYDVIDGADLVDKISGTTVTYADIMYVYKPDDENYKDKIGTLTISVQGQIPRSGAGALSVEFGEDAVQFYLVNQPFETYGILVHLLYQSSYEEDGVWYGRRDPITNPNFRIGSMVAQGYTITAQDLSSEKVVLRAISGSNSGTLDVSVVDKVARGLEVSSTDHKTVYYVGETFDFSDMEFRVTFGPGDPPQEGLKKGSIKADLSGIPDYANGAFTEPGAKTVTFKYFDVPCPVTFTVKPKEDLQIIRPTNLVLTYRNGEELTAPQLKFSVDGATYGQSELSGVTVRTTVTDKATGSAAVLGAKKEGTYNVRYTFTVTNPRFNRPAAIDIEVRVTENPYTVTIDVPTSGLSAAFAKDYISIPKPTVGNVMDTTDGNKAVPDSYVEKIFTVTYKGEKKRDDWQAFHAGVYTIDIVVNVKPYKGYGEYEAGRASYEFTVTKAENDPANITLTVPQIVLLDNANNFNFKVEADFGAETAVLKYSKTGTDGWTTDKPTEAGRWFVRAEIAEETVYGDYTGVTSDVIAFNVRKTGTEADTSSEGSVEGSISGSEGVEGDWKLTIKESAVEDVSINKQTALYGYNVSLVDKNGVAVKASGEYTIKIKLSDEQVEALSGKTVKLFSYDAEGKATEIKDAKVKDGYVEFTTGEFGRFVVTEAIPKAAGVPVGLIVGVSLGAVAAAGMIAAVIIVFLKKKRGSQK